MKRTVLDTLSLSIYFLQQNRMNVVLLVGSTQVFDSSVHNNQVSNVLRKPTYLHSGIDFQTSLVQMQLQIKLSCSHSQVKLSLSTSELSMIP